MPILRLSVSDETMERLRYLAEGQSSSIEDVAKAIFENNVRRLEATLREDNEIIAAVGAARKSGSGADTAA
jgi:hypothetical protein